MPIQPLGTKPPIFCVHGGAGTILHLEPSDAGSAPTSRCTGCSRGAVRRSAAATDRRGDGDALPLGDPSGATVRPVRVRRVCFGAIVAFEMAQRMLAEGEGVRLVASFNGPSPSWIKRWGWFGNQPSLRRPRPKVQRLSRSEKMRRALREPFRIRRAFLYHSNRRLRRLHARVALARGRPLPETVREQYFLRIHGYAERAYEPRPYPAELVTFFGDRLYEDPTMGWDGLALGGVDANAVPGEHTNNRQLIDGAQRRVRTGQARRVPRLGRKRSPMEEGSERSTADCL